MIFRTAFFAALLMMSNSSLAAIGFRGAYGSQNATGGTSIDMMLPADVQDGDVLVMNITVVGGTGTTITTPAGWTLLNSTNSTTALKQSLYWKVASSEPVGYTVTITSNKASGTIVALTGARIAAPVAAQYAGQAYSSSTTFSAPVTSTWTSRNGMRLVFGGTAVGTTTNTVASGFTKGAEGASSGGSAGSRTTSAIQYKAESAVTTSAAFTQTTFWSAAAVQVNHQVFIYEENIPTIALNTADATAFGADTTPTLEFTGTEALNSDDIRYNVQLDTVNTFDSSPGGSVLDQSYDGARDGPAYVSGTAFAQKVGQSFTSAGGSIVSAQFYLSKSGSPTGNAVAKLYAETHATAFGTDSLPTGAALATSNSLDVSTLTGSYVLKTFTFPTPYAMVNGTNYVISVEFNGGDSSNMLAVGRHFVTNAAPGNFAEETGSTWYETSSHDLVFFVYVQGVGPLLDKLSGTDSGFVNTVSGGDTDPFNSGEKTSFTVQAGNALSNGTYYWRARATSPNNTTSYSSWSSIRTFTISTGGSSYRVRHRVTHSP